MVKHCLLAFWKSSTIRSRKSKCYYFVVEESTLGSKPSGAFVFKELCMTNRHGCFSLSISQILCHNYTEMPYRQVLPCHIYFIYSYKSLEILQDPREGTHLDKGGGGCISFQQRRYPHKGS